MLSVGMDEILDREMIDFTGRLFLSVGLWEKVTFGPMTSCLATVTLGLKPCAVVWSSITELLTC